MNPAKAIAIIIASYPNTKLDAGNVSAYNQWLKQIPETELEAAIMQAMIKSPNFPPTGPGIVACWQSTRTETQVLDATLEWTKCLTHAERYGEIVYPSDPKLYLSDAGEYALRLIGGRSGILNTKDQDTHWAQRNFIEAWNKFSEAEKSGHALSQGETRQLLGLVDAERKKELPAADTLEPSAIAGADEIVSALREAVVVPKPKQDVVVDGWHVLQDE